MMDYQDPEEAVADRERERYGEWVCAMDDAILDAFTRVGETSLPSEAARELILAALRQLAEAGDAGFALVDAYFGHHLATYQELSVPEAAVGKAYVRRYRDRLDPALVRGALEEPSWQRAPVGNGDGFRVPLVRGAREMKAMQDRIIGEVVELPSPAPDAVQAEPELDAAQLSSVAGPVKKPAAKKPIKVSWGDLGWTAKTHNAAQQDIVVDAGMSYDPEWRRYVGDVESAGRLRECIASPADIQRLDTELEALRKPQVPEAPVFNQAVPDYRYSFNNTLPALDFVADLPSVVADSPKRRRGRPTNAELGRAPALSQVERNRRYRARKQAGAAATMPRDIADRLAAARGAPLMTSGALLAEALDALGA